MAAESYRTYQFEGYQILVGKGARDNDTLTFKVASPQDFWLHAAGYAGSHVVVRNPDRGEVPRSVLSHAAGLAAHFSKAREAGGKVEVHYCRVHEVSKPKGFPAGKVVLKKWKGLKVYAFEPAEGL